MSNSVFRGLKRLLIRIVFAQFLLGLIPQGFARPDGITNSTAATTLTHSTNGPSELRFGEQLARQYCQSCHLFPEPDLLDKATWEKGALPMMSKWLGISKMNLDLRPGRKIVEAASLFPSSPILPDTDWEAIRKYYIESAPEKPLPQVPHPKIRMGLNQFKVVSPDYRFQIPLTTLVKIDPDAKQFYLGDAGTKTLNVLDPQGNMKFSCPIDSPAVGLVIRQHHFYATLIGSVTPSDEPQGELVEFKQGTNGFQKNLTLAENLMRPVEAVFADLNNDGKEDFVICSFGNYIGRFSWFENLGGNKYGEHILLELPGAVRACVYDFNKDGLLDIIVMMAQAREG